MKTKAFDNCRKADKFKEEEPERYTQLITKLAELEDCRAKIKEMREWEREVVHAIHDLQPPYEATYGGIGKITVNKSHSRKWDNEKMWDVLIARALDSRRVNKETGEVLEREAWAVRRVIEECAYISYWRMQPLVDTYGIDPDEYHVTSSSRKAVRIQN